MKSVGEVPGYIVAGVSVEVGGGGAVVDTEAVTPML